jgi:hypothetical protein
LLRGRKFRVAEFWRRTGKEDQEAFAFRTYSVFWRDRICDITLNAAPPADLRCQITRLLLAHPGREQPFRLRRRSDRTQMDVLCQVVGMHRELGRSGPWRARLSRQLPLENTAFLPRVVIATKGVRPIQLNTRYCRLTATKS